MYGWFAIAAGLVGSAVGCAGDDPDDPGPDTAAFVAPATPAQVSEAYSRLGTCNDSFIVRSFLVRTALSPSSLWTAPAGDPAGFVRLRAAGGSWPSVLTVGELDGGGVGGDVTATSPDAPCVAVNRLFSPHTPEGTNRSEYVHSLLYVGDSEHPYTSYPNGVPTAASGDAVLSLKSYLNAVSAVRETTTDGVVFREAIEQHLPMYVSCTRPLQVESTLVVVEQRELERYDRAMCDTGSDEDRDGVLSYRCIAERVVNTQDNTCTFVVDGRALANAGEAVPVIFGGTLTARGAGAQLRYELRVDRFATAR